MTRGNVKRQFDQTGYPPIRINILEHSQIVVFEQGNSKIYVRFPYMDEFALEVNEIKNWTMPVKNEVDR